jgi:hypothetical protein
MQQANSNFFQYKKNVKPKQIFLKKKNNLRLKSQTRLGLISLASIIRIKKCNDNK